jgi:hypothetical protein
MRLSNEKPGGRTKLLHMGIRCITVKRYEYHEHRAGHQYTSINANKINKIRTPYKTQL